MTELGETSVWTQQCRQAWKVEKQAGQEILGGKMGEAGNSVNLCGLKDGRCVCWRPG